jgi:predicted XRE-type DNA-binding protein
MIHHENSSGNVYEDLGSPVAADMRIKATLVQKISARIAEKGWTQMEAASLLGLPQPRISAILNGKFRDVSQQKLMECLIRLGHDIDIVVHPIRKEEEIGHLAVVLEA